MLVESFVVSSPHSTESMLWTLHAQPAWHHGEEKPPNPSRHAVSLWRTVVHVQHEHGDDDRQRDKDHSEKQILSDERDDQRRGRDDLCYEQQEDGERQQHGDAQRDFLTAVWRQVENQDGEAGDEQAGDDEVDGVEQRQTADDKVVGDVWVNFVAAVVFLGVVGAHSIDNRPLSALPVVLEVRFSFKTVAPTWNLCRRS